MKRILQTLFSTVVVFSMVTVFISCNKNNDNNLNNDFNTRVFNLPKQPLNSDEQATLPFMREEEKLARDVYTFLYSMWQINIFSNISSAEQAHMDAVLLLLNKYKLPDPAGNNPAGVFTNSTLQTLYNQLTTKGSVSLLDALKVGATIEDLDINDLKTALTKADNQDIRLVYENLVKGSRNHLRSFYSNILSAGGTYTPQYISQAEFDAIINSPMETGQW
jgi:hypothetical protein